MQEGTEPDSVASILESFVTFTSSEWGWILQLEVKRPCQKWDSNPRLHSENRNPSTEEGTPPCVWRLRPLGHPDLNSREKNSSNLVGRKLLGLFELWLNSCGLYRSCSEIRPPYEAQRDALSGT